MTKISNQYSLTNILTADLANSRLGINNVSPTVALDVTGAGRFSGNVVLSGSDSRFNGGDSVGRLILSNSNTTTYIALYGATHPTLPYVMSFVVNAASALAIASTGAATFSSTITSLATSGQATITAEGSATSGEGAFTVKGKNSSGIIRTGSFKYDNADILRIGTSSAIAMRFETSDVERMRITSAGQILIGTTSATAFDKSIIMNSVSSTAGLLFQLNGVDKGFVYSGGGELYMGSNSNNVLLFTNGAERMRITTAGNVGIGTSSPTGAAGLALVLNSGASQGRICIKTSATGDASGDGLQIGVSGTGAFIEQRENAELSFATNASERMRITSGGNLLVGTSSDSGYKFEVNGGNSAVATRVISSGSTTAGTLWDGGGAPSFHAWSRPQDCGIGSNNFTGASILIKTGMTYGSFTTGTTRIEIQSGGAVIIPGSLSKGSGSFRIDHPLKPDTHQLVHSFIEGPQADLIYRGKLTLVNGKAQANIDEVSTMTEGTFEALCREVQCFTTNENGWDLVKGKVIGNIIYIESQNPNSTDEISWMVIGERKDKHMMDTEWTDEQGKVIVEPLKQK